MARRLWITIVCVIVIARTAAADEHPRLEMVVSGARVELPLVASDLRVEVRGVIASVRHRQRFHNPASAPIEAIYTFPLHEDAAVGAMVMRIGPRTIRAQIAERAAARAAYERAQAAGKTAALLEQQRPNIFTQSVTGILPGEVIDVELSYDVLLEPTDGWYELALPTVVGPRYIPSRGVDDAALITPPGQVAGATPATTFGFGLDLQTPFPVAQVDSPTHELVATELSHEHLAITLAEPDAVSDKDLVVRWRVEVAEPAIGVLAGGGYLAAIVQPPALAGGKAAPREIVFVLDTSGSMDGEPIAIVKQAIRYALDHLEPDDRFRLINFSTEVGGFEGGAALAATVDNRRRARSWLNAMSGDGGTEMLSGIRAALADPPADRVRYVCFMTDGYIGNETEILAAIDRGRGARTHLFSFGVGSSVNRYLLDEMARAGHGASQVLLLDDPPQPQIARFFRQLMAPMWSEVRVEFPGLDATQVAPAVVGDLFAGEPIVVAARTRGEGRGRVRVIGKVDGAVVTLEREVTLAGAGGDGAVLGRLWGRHRIRDLAAAARTGDHDAARQEITAIALEHALASPYTSFVAIDDQVRTPDGVTPIGIPVETPEGVSLAGATLAENVYIVDGLGGEVITISDRIPTIDQASTSQGMVIDSDHYGVVAAHQPSGRAGGEVAGLFGIDGDGATQRSLRGGLRLTLGSAYQLGVGASLSWRAREPALFGFFASVTRWRVWQRLALRLAAGVGARVDDVRPRVLWRAEALVPFGGGARWQPLLTVGVEDARDDGRPPAGLFGVGLEF